MASERTVDRIVPLSVLQPQLSAPEHSPGVIDKAIDAMPSSSSDDLSSIQENENGRATEIEDDDVQFVFSVPRRKRKKRKRVGSICNSASGMQELEVSRCLPSSTSTSSPSPSPIIRRGSTGMVRLLESCHMSENTPFTMKSGSLPTVVQGPQALSQLDYTEPDHLLLQQTQPFPFPDELSWWDVQTPYAHTSGSFQFDICGMPFAEEVLKKRKHAEEHDGQEPERGVGPSQHSPKKRSAAQFCRIPACESSYLGGLHGSNSDLRTGANFDITSKDSRPPTTSRQAFPIKQLNSCLPPQKVTTFPRKALTVDHTDYQDPQQQISRQIVSPGEHSFNDWTQQQFIQVPVSLIPELSVSPRTKTVQVFRQADLGRIQLHKTPSQPFAMPRTTPLTQPCEQSTIHSRGQSPHFNNQRSDRDTINKTQSRFPAPETAVRDILRKPSLYRIPPWPSSPESLNLPHNLSGKNLNSDNEVAQRAATPSQLPNATSAVGSVANTTSAIRRQHEGKTYTAHEGVAASDSNSQQQISRPISTTAPPQLSCRIWQASHGPDTLLNSNPGSGHSSSRPARKHSPNLIVDIAETCQENFPFAAVAERHKQPLQKVFDTFSAIIQLPLLRSAADNRRHGDLAKTRMKDFRDAKKAMDKAQELERKKASKETSKAEMDDSVIQKKPKKAPELLKAAILNNARSKED